ncbi:MAG: endonuclease I family protein [Bacilli bacterium]|jgi:endonuclease I
MAKTKKTTTEKKVEKQVKKEVKKFQKTKAYKILTFVVAIVLIIGVAVTYVLYPEAFENLFNQKQDSIDNPTYSSSQNSFGFYYYTPSTDEADYYYSANDLVGTTLVDKLNQILNENFSPTSYAEAKTHLAAADISLTDSTKVMNVYDGALVNATWDSTSWHREHVWPNARLGMARVTESGRNQASDLHNLRAITPRVNSSRSDRWYSDATGECQTVSNGGYYPGDAHKGDVARIIFYMAIMYKDILTLTDVGLEDESNHYTPAGAKMGELTVLLKWHKEDPVDEFERNRNQVIYEAQGNRTPFIDKPEYVHLIWEDKTITDLTLVEETDSSASVEPVIALIDFREKLWC